MHRVQLFTRFFYYELLDWISSENILGPEQVSYRSEHSEHSTMRHHSIIYYLAEKYYTKLPR